MRTFIFLFLALLSNLLAAQELSEILEQSREGVAARIVFYNLENLFDTIDDGKVRDEEFLPKSEKEWNTPRYRTKISKMAKAIRAVGGWSPPELVGVSEIENRLVMLDLADHPVLSKANYEVLHFDSDDPRGIDVGLLYNHEIIEILHAEPIRMRKEQFRTRDILYAKALFYQTDTLHIFVNHWSSRRGGKEQSEPKRLAAAEIVRTYTDSIQNTNRNALVLVMGDFNDAPNDNSLHILSEKANVPLVNLMADMPSNSGSHKYRGIWDYLDQILVSEALLDESVPNVKYGKAFVFRDEFLLEQDERYGDYYPYRTWKGPIFIAGYSDHLPVFVDIMFK